MKRSGEGRSARLGSLMFDIAGGIAKLVVILGVPIGITYWNDVLRCKARWVGTAPAQHSMFGGCRVLMPDGRWVPEDQFRVVDFTEVVESYRKTPAAIARQIMEAEQRLEEAHK